jgi:hypothetical protein
MNIVQLHERVRFWVDIVASARFDSLDIDNALNASIDMKVRESYDKNRPMNRSDSFQRVQRVRDELGRLVKFANLSNGLSVTPGEEYPTAIDLSSIEDYGYLLAVKFRNGSSWHPCYP